MSSFLGRSGLCLLVAALPILSVNAASDERPPHRVFINFAHGQKALAKRLVAESRGAVHYDFDELDSIAATVPEEALEGIRQNGGIVSLEEDPPRFLQAETYPYGIEMTQANQLWDADNDKVID